MVAKQKLPSSKQAKLLLEFAKSISDSKSPNQAEIRRAVSACYYAIFHTLCAEAGIVFYGKHSPTNKNYIKIYRAINHGHLKSVCKQYKGRNSNEPPIMQRFAEFIFEMQENRHIADYEPFHKQNDFILSDLKSIVSDTDRQIYLWRGFSKYNKRKFLIDVLFPDRKN